MGIIKSIAIAFSTYTIVPVPHFKWTEKNMRYSLAFFPVVGILLAAILFGWYWLCGIAEISHIVGASVAAAIPFIYTGGIHMDGFCDTVDALSSHADRKKKLEILKDSHIGAFAVIRSCVYIILYFCFTYEIWGTDYYPIACVGFVMSRGTSALLATILPKARNKGMLSAYTKNQNVKFATSLSAVYIIFSTLLIILLNPLIGAAVAVFSAIWAIIYMRNATKNFGGVTGDTAGYYLQYAELILLAAIIVGNIILGVAQ